MRKIKTDKSTQLICNSLSYSDIAHLTDNANRAQKQALQKDKSVIFTYDKLNMMVTIPAYFVPKRNNNLGKIFAYVLSEIQFDKSGKPATNDIRIPIRSIVKNNIYAQKSNAIRGLLSVSKVFQHIEIEITKQNTYNKPEMNGYFYRCDSMFTGFRISEDASELIVRINPDAPWTLFKNQYLEVPDEWFGLPSRSFNLVHNVAIIARRSATTISKHGYMDIDLREVAFWLGLPDEKNYNQSRRDIKDPIDNAINDANATESDFVIVKNYDMDRTVSDFLDRGFIRVFIEGKTRAEIEVIARKRATA